MQDADIIPIGDNIYRPLVDGIREGDDARDVLSEAIDWWEAELRAIEMLAASQLSPSRDRGAC
jgi:hypothetical protein